MKNRILVILSVLFALGLQTIKAQEQPPIPQDDKNWISSINYDYTGKTIGKSVGFYNQLGKATQNQSWDILTNKVWNSQILYDSQGRPVFQTLSAPHGNNFGYNPNFVFANFSGIDTPYTSFHFEADEDEPAPVSSLYENTLGYYYSTNNDNDYQDITQYPFSRTIFSRLNPGGVKKVLGGNKVNGEWLQSYSFTMKASEELSYVSAFNDIAYRDWRVVKTVNRDVHGIETVVFSDSDGKVLAAARSGNEETGTITNVKNNEISIGEQGWVDIHVSKGCTTSIRLFSVTTNSGSTTGGNNGGNNSDCDDLTISDEIIAIPDEDTQDCFNQNRMAVYESNPENSSKSEQQKTQEVGELLYAREVSTNPNLPEGIYYRIYDLITEEVVMEVTPGTHNLPYEGFFRVELRYGIYVNLGALPVHYSFGINERPGYFDLENKDYFVDHCQNYYDYSLNYYDKAGRLLKSTQPNGKDFNSEFKYNSLGQLLSTNNIDEGEARFAYRKDGQIRFSQNTNQQFNEEFSYTNYDRLGRPVESGVYRGGDIFIPNIILAEDGTTPYDPQEVEISGPITPIHNQNIELGGFWGIFGYGYKNNASESTSWQSSLASNEVIVGQGFLRFRPNYSDSMIPDITDDGSGPGDGGGVIITNPDDTGISGDETSTNVSTDENRTVSNGRDLQRSYDFYNIIVGLVESNKDSDFVVDDIFPMAYGINLVAKINQTTGAVTYHTYIMEDGQLVTETVIDITTGNPVEVTRNFGAFDPSGQYSVHRTSSEIQYKLNGNIFYSSANNNSQTLVAKALFKNTEDGVSYILLDEVLEAPPTNPFEGIIDELDGLNDNNCYEQHFTEYDVPDQELQDRLADCGLPQKAYQQTFLSGNVSKTYTLKPSTNATWYSYDVYGRVKWLVQMPNGMDCLKTIDYVYDDVTGQVIEVDYQRYNRTERFIHRYNYNDAGQLISVETSTDDSSFILHATYKYNETGQLIRTELAENLQGIDYVYNLSGQLKAINHPSLSSNNDPGNDGANGFISDVFGMTIQYHQDDYTRPSTPTPISNITASTSNQFNGNIQAIQWQNQNGGSSTYSYGYNKNNWLKEAQYSSSSASSGDYNVNNISYDANGNIKTLNRNGYTDANGDNSMDAFAYHYKTNSNQLTTVEDSNDNSDPTRYDDLKNQAELETSQDPFGNPELIVTNENYTYNSIGQLVINAQEGIGYEYNASGLVTKIKGFSSSDTDNYLTLAEENYEGVTCNNGWNTADIWFNSLEGGLRQNGRIAFVDQLDQEENFEDEECMRARLMDDLGDPNDLIALPLYCSDFDSTSDASYNNRHQINFYEHSPNNTYSTSTRFNTVPNAYHKLSLDVILLKEQTQRVTNASDPSIWETQTQPINITNALVEVLEYSSSGTETVLATTNITNSNALFCNRIANNVDIAFTPTKQKIKLRITVVNDGENPGLLPSNFSKIFQTIEVDNILFQIANEDKLAFFYDDRGHRIRKEVYNGSSTQTTFYVRDASGSPIAIYQKGNGQPLTAKEYPIYGASRLGILYNEPKYREKGTYAYQLTDHLGNVRAVVMKSGPNAISLTSKTDYYPFGMPMPNRNVEGNYRYGYQG
ncbi:MAG: hypothetical protein CMC05_12695, partial [Flavobacteriaceae bacterium]|nr:hypothetical protein [Flavobacteriaceae bacterium]